MSDSQNPPSDHAEFLSASGSGEIPRRLRRTGVQVPASPSHDELDLYILRLLALHPTLPTEKLSPGDLQTMAIESKKQLLVRLQSLLGIDAAAIGNS